MNKRERSCINRPHPPHCRTHTEHKPQIPQHIIIYAENCTVYMFTEFCTRQLPVLYSISDQTSTPPTSKASTPKAASALVDVMSLLQTASLVGTWGTGRQSGMPVCTKGHVMCRGHIMCRKEYPLVRWRPRARNVNRAPAHMKQTHTHL